MEKIYIKEVRWLKIINKELYLIKSNSKSDERKSKGEILRKWKENEKVNIKNISKIINL